MNFRSPYARLIAFAAIFILVVTLLAAAAFAATPAFSVHKNGTAQTVVGDTATKLTWSHEAFDTNTNFAASRFTPTIAGTYLIVVSVQCAQTGACIPAIYKNGTLYAASRITSQTFADQSPQATALVSMNGSTDYVEAFATSAGTSITGLATQTYFSGSQIDGTGSGTSQWIDGTGGTIYYNGGNVGIGTTTPQSALDLGVAANGRSIVWGGSTGVNHYASIGTTYSSAALSLVRGLKLATGGADQYLYSYATGTRAGIRIGGGSASDISFFNEPSATQTVDAPFDYITNTKMTIRDSGNVGIGTTTPTSILQISSAGDAVLTIEADTDNVTETDNPIILFMQDGGGVTARLGIGVTTAENANRFQMFNDYAAGLDLGTSGTARLSIDADGNVGIGTTSPSYLLHVDLGSAGTGSFMLSDVTAPGSGLSLGEGGSAANTFSPLIRGFPSGSATLFTGLYSEIAAANDTGAVPAMVFTARRTPAAALTNRPPFQWRNNATNLMTIDTDGNVGIGTTTPSTLLDVNGSATASGYVQRCPAGFTLVGNATRSLGCIQTAENAAATWNAANDACFDNHGGRLPFSSEWHIATANYALTGETGNWEWLADYVGGSSPYDNHAVVGNSSITDYSWNDDTYDYNYRCFLPK